jgi:hypothetical protein
MERAKTGRWLVNAQHPAARPTCPENEEELGGSPMPDGDEKSGRGGAGSAHGVSVPDAPLAGSLVSALLCNFLLNSMRF